MSAHLSGGNMSEKLLNAINQALIQHSLCGDEVALEQNKPRFVHRLIRMDHPSLPGVVVRILLMPDGNPKVMFYAPSGFVSTRLLEMAYDEFRAEIESAVIEFEELQEYERKQQRGE